MQLLLVFAAGRGGVSAAAGPAGGAGGVPAGCDSGQRDAETRHHTTG